MAQTIATAVAAIAAQQTRLQAIRALSAEGIELLAMESDASHAMNALEKLRPDLLIADMELPMLDGVQLAQRIFTRFRLPVRPAAILLRYPEFDIACEAELRVSGVLLLEKPLEMSAFHESIEKLSSDFPRFAPVLVRRADELLDALGVPQHRGRDCLRLAMLMCAADERCRYDLGGRLYPRLGCALGLDAAQVERAIRHVIDRAWQSDKFDNQYRIFADTIDAGRGQPTCGEMISRLADILRSEG